LGKPERVTFTTSTQGCCAKAIAGPFALLLVSRKVEDTMSNIPMIIASRLLLVLSIELFIT